MVEGKERKWGECVVCGGSWKGPTVLVGGTGGESGWVGCWGCFWSLGEEEKQDEGEKKGEREKKGEGEGGWWKGRVDRERMRRVLL